jgi:hypothetical protein
VPDIDAELMGCCGLNGIYNLSDSCNCGGDCNEDCEVEPQSNYASIFDATQESEHRGIIIAITNQQQEDDGIGHKLTHAGFHPVLNTLNTNSSNRITLWVRDHTEGKVPVTLTSQRNRQHHNLLMALSSYAAANPNPRSASAKALLQVFEENT